MATFVAGVSLFDVTAYLNANSDVKTAAGSLSGSALNDFAFTHFLTFGAKEGRDPLGMTPTTAVPNTLTAGSGTNFSGDTGGTGTATGGIFDAVFYLNNNADVKNAAGSLTGSALAAFALSHFVQFGAAEGRNPSAGFSQRTYDTSNTDVARAVALRTTTDIQHYLQFGEKEGRSAPTVSGGTTTGSTFTLTTGADSITITTPGSTVNGLVDGTTAANSTMTAADQIAGGATTSNTLAVTYQGNSVSDATNGALISGIQTFSLRETVAANTVTLTASNISGLTSVVDNLSAGAVKVVNLASGASATENGNGSLVTGTFNIGYTSSATTGTLTLNGGLAKTSGTITITGTGLTSQTVNSTGAANTLKSAGATGLALAATETTLTVNATTNLTTNGITGAALKTINVSGAATNVDLSGTVALPTTVATLNASGLTAGGVSAIYNKSTFVFTGGAGNDAITSNNVALVSGGSLDAGSGTDTITITNAADLTATTGALMKNFEILGVTNAITVDMANLSVNNTITGLVLNGAGAQVVNNVTTAAAGNVQITASDTPTISVVNATNPGNIDTVSILVSDNSSTVNTLTITTPTLSGIENLKLTATDNIVITSLANATALTSITSTGAGTLSITTGAVAANANETIDASAETGNVTIDATSATANGLKITGSSTKTDTLTGSKQADQIIGGSGNDSIINETTGATASAGDILTGGAGNDTFTLRGDSASAATYAASSNITDFSIGTAATTSGVSGTDILRLSATIANYSAGGAFFAGVGGGAGTAQAAGATAIQSVAQNASSSAITAGTDLVKLTTGVTAAASLQLTFNSAIGSGVVTGFTASDRMIVSLYDTTNSKMIVGIVDTTNGSNTKLESGDVITLVGTLNMSAADYASFTNANLSFIAS